MAQSRYLKLIVAGSRDWPWRQYIFDALDHYTKNYPKEYIEIVDGGALGADRCGRDWAIERGIKYKTMNADWDGLGMRAGLERNTQMAEYANAAIVFWNGKSTGSADMIRKASMAGMRVVVINLLKITGEKQS